MSSRIAVFGGMFDPVHNGHVEAARFALNYLEVNRLKMIPCQLPNHKEQARSSSAHRLAMLELALLTDENIEADAIEINRPGISYTVDTLTELRLLERQSEGGLSKGQVQLVFVLGVDSFNTLEQWHQWSRLMDLCHFLVLARPGSEISVATAEALNIEQRLVQTTQQMFASESGKILYAEKFHFDISSTSIREKLSLHPGAVQQLDERVFTYIKNNHLYGL
ncbi:MAG: hypothetical protein COA96_15990 [SAR86 cluster bacterium]|uniref:Probable nicotinate-nucleotide adenylyltransferase n=1 Tax=SAR86 cluster bacterium TaxID=2030880 RepID=A0A2A5ALL7_9GAMM|nr:MAG: hypothetical protein COA96_15990 [SAR86 cluster bacterium]